MKAVCVACALVTALLLTACGSSSSSSSAPASTSGSSASPLVNMQNIAFTPGTLQAKVGQTVTFKNEDSPPRPRTPYRMTGARTHGA